MYAAPSSDMFSLGVIVYMLVSGGVEPFWDGNCVKTIKETIRRTIKGKWNFNHTSFRDVSEGAKSFIDGLLRLSPRDRLSTSQCLGHPWLNEVKILKPLILNTAFMRKYLARRRWHKAIAAVKAVNRIRHFVAESEAVEDSHPKMDWYTTITEVWV